MRSVFPEPDISASVQCPLTTYLGPRPDSGFYGEDDRRRLHEMAEPIARTRRHNIRSGQQFASQDRGLTVFLLQGRGAVIT